MRAGERGACLRAPPRASRRHELQPRMVGSTGVLGPGSWVQVLPSCQPRAVVRPLLWSWAGLVAGGTRRGLSQAEASGPPWQVPSALLTFSWDAAVLEDIKAAGAEPDSSILKPELLSVIEKLS